MPEMTIAPVATHGFFVDGRWWEEGDLVAVRAGARLLCGGGRKNLVVEPTVLTGTKADMKVNCQEIF